MTRTARPTCVSGFSGRLPALVAVSLAGLGFSAPPAAAQPIPPADTQPPSELCRVYAIPGAEGQPSELRANCRGNGLVLGSVTEFEAIPNDALQATLVDARRGSERRVLLLTIQESGFPLVEDLSGQIALAAGRGPMSELARVELYLNRFMHDGEIGVNGRPEDSGSAKADEIDLGEQIAFEQSRSGDVATQD